MGASRSRDVILPLYSVLVRCHLKYYIHMWCLQYRRNTDLLLCIVRTAIKMIQGVEHPSYKHKLRGFEVVQTGEEREPGRSENGLSVSKGQIL